MEDPDARVGRGKKGFMLGYQSLFLTEIEGLPLGHEEAPLNVNEKQLVETLLIKVLGESIEVELAAADSQFESQTVFEILESLKICHIVAWRRLKGRVNPPMVLSVKDRIDVEGPEWLRVIYKRLRAASRELQRQGEEQARVSAVDVAGIGECRYSRGVDVDGCLCCVYRRLQRWAARATSIRGLLRLRLDQRWLGYIEDIMSPVAVTDPFATWMFLLPGFPDMFFSWI